ncbi:MAG: hypothetical protein ABL860_02350 [Candidatus Nitrotoga sp.]
MTQPKQHTLVATSVFNKILAGHGFTGGLHCRKANQGNDPWCHLAPCIPSRKADVAAMWD